MLVKAHDWGSFRLLAQYSFIKNVLKTFYSLFSPQLVVTVLSHHCNSRTDSGEVKVKSRASSKTQPRQARLTQKPAAPMCRRKHCTPGNRVSLHAPGPAHHRSLQSAIGQGHPGRPNPPLTRMTLGQLCVASWVSRSRPAATQPGIEPGSVLTQILRHSGDPSGPMSQAEWVRDTLVEQREH
jgi:hypothetical protein